MPTPLTVPQTPRNRSRRTIAIAAGAVALLLSCLGLAVVVAMVARWAMSATEPFPPYPNEKPGTYAPPTEQQKRWALALDAVLAEQNTERHDTLGCTRVSPDSHDHVSCTRSGLADGWGIRSREDLLESLAWLETSGHRRGYDPMLEGTPKRTVAAWDYGRYVMLCRAGFTLGFLTEEEAWRRIMPVARLMQSTYPSWAEYGDRYVEGREIWSEGGSNQAGVREIRARLTADPQSPWSSIPWALDLGAAGTAP